MDLKLHSVAGGAIYSVHKTGVEPVFGQIKGARGLNQVNGEWGLMATTHNLLKLFRAVATTA